ncbi:MAG: hypothetical protein EA391_08670 [Balneolaceae bacterium]|nr:MAG: hypothetical protein EA391_08670 [Balneolaceae bacterium]
MSFKQRFDNWIFNSFTVSAEGLALFRIFASLFILLFLIPGMGMGHFGFLASLPNHFYAPSPGPLRIFDGFPPLVFFQLVHTILVISLFAMLAGYFTKWASLITGISILILQGFIYSIGKVNHEIVVPLVPIIMAFSNWGYAYSVDSMRKKKTRNPESWPLTLLALFVAFMMFTAGFPKILGGWLDPSTQAAQGHLFNQFFIRERQALLAGWAVGFNNVVFWEMLDWLTILFEIGFIAALFKASWFRLFVGFAVVFHFSTMMTLNIAFLPNFLAYAVFLNWENVYSAIRSQYVRFSGITGIKSGKRAVILFSGLVLLIFLPLKWLSSRNITLSQTDLMFHEFVLVTAAFVFVLFIGVKKW